METPAISVIIIEYFCLDVLSDTISGIKKGLSKFSYEILISSNSCYDPGIQESVKVRFPGTTWIFNKKMGDMPMG